MAQEPSAAKRPEPETDPVEKFIAEEKTREQQRHELIKEILRQKEAAIKAFDEKLAKLGHEGNHGKRSHHTKRDDKKAPE